jgi:hypothetical protein
VSKPNDSTCPESLHRVALAATSLVAAVAVIAGTGLIFGATAGIASQTVERIAPTDSPPVAAPAARPTGTYQLRCWQYGRLLFDEGPVTLGPEARQSARLVAIDRNGAPLIVTGAGGTTCLARPHAAAPNLALPR